MRDHSLRPPDPAKARWLDAPTAARYLDLRETAFSRQVKAGKLPAPSYQLGTRTPRWDRLALDAAMAGSAVRDKQAPRGRR